MLHNIFLDRCRDNNSYWDILLPKTDTMLWKKFQNLKNSIFNHVKWIIGNGETINIWIGSLIKGYGGIGEGLLMFPTLKSHLLILRFTLISLLVFLSQFGICDSLQQIPFLWLYYFIYGFWYPIII